MQSLVMRQRKAGRNNKPFDDRTIHFTGIGAMSYMCPSTMSLIITPETVPVDMDFPKAMASGMYAYW